MTKQTGHITFPLTDALLIKCTGGFACGASTKGALLFLQMSSQFCCACSFLETADFPPSLCKLIVLLQIKLTLELVCVCFLNTWLTFTQKGHFCFLFVAICSVTWITTVWWMAALHSTHCAPCSFTLTCRRSQTLPLAWGGMTSTSASAQVFTQHNKKITVQRIPLECLDVVEFSL